jgi:hypothetical protein
VPPTPLSAEQKRAIGDFLLFAGANALAFLNAELTAGIPPGAPEALYAPVFERIHAIWNRHFESVNRLRYAIEDIADPTTRLGVALEMLARHALDNREPLLQDYVEMTALARAMFRLATTEASESVLRFLSHLARHTHRLSDVRNSNAAGPFAGFDIDGLTAHRYSPWSRTNDNDGEDWDEAYALVNLCAHLPLREVLFAALHDLSQHYHPRHLVDRVYDWPQNEAERDELVTRLREGAAHVWATLFRHPIFVDFWFALRQLRGRAALRAEVAHLKCENADDPLLAQALVAFHADYLQS